MNTKIADFIADIGRRGLLGRLFGGAAAAGSAVILAPGRAMAQEKPAAVTFGVWTGNLERLMAFYKALGCEVGEIRPLPKVVGKVVELAPEAMVRNCFFTYQGSRVEISEAKPLPGDASRKPLFQAGMIHMAFRTDDVDKMMDDCTKAGGTVQANTLTKLGNGFATVYAYDPDGTRIQFSGPSKKAV